MKLFQYAVIAIVLSCVAIPAGMVSNAVAKSAQEQTMTPEQKKEMKKMKADAKKACVAYKNKNDQPGFKKCVHDHVTAAKAAKATTKK